MYTVEMPAGWVKFRAGNAVVTSPTLWVTSPTLWVTSGVLGQKLEGQWLRNLSTLTPHLGSEQMHMQDSLGADLALLSG
jgi:hypothetical protein